MIDRRTLLGTLSAATISGVALSTLTSAMASASPGLTSAGLVDVHSHMVPDFYLREALASGIVLPDGMPKWPSWSVDEHLQMMDGCGIDSAILSVSSPGVHFGDDGKAAELARRVNDFGAGVVANRPRLGFFASLPLPNVVDSTVEAIRALDQLRADGVTVMSNAGGMYLGNAALTPLLVALDARSAVVLVHPTSPPNSGAVSLGRPAPMIEFLFDTAQTVVDLLLLGVVDRFSNIRWVFTHGGGVLPLLADRVDFFRTQVGLGTPTTPDVLQRLWFDLAGTPVPRQLPALLSTVGPDRLVYGSDYCFTPIAAVQDQLQSLDAGAANGGLDNWRGTTSGNARRLLDR
ncbi:MULTISPECIES: amidohydrolase family protein [unclassified Rhodococcus (in: high G+C Gram-positive bacteria)]|uniref:amidohydrolase family protein n=1 Tax=unclassified Rhodococcus (in: high G+C Gram-positive bacteria) TaxID=192944 RepID=UPI0020CD3609|nr:MULTISPECIES: amidohydrolase family protein [unclassified Rhodococcus (in: high G+C Gram-positive bacteria)]